MCVTAQHHPTRLTPPNPPDTVTTPPQNAAERARAARLKAAEEAARKAFAVFDADGNGEVGAGGHVCVGGGL